MTLRQAVPLMAVLALALWSVAFASPYDLRVLTVAGVYAIMVLGYQFVFGHAGALSLAQGAFFGLGAYATGILGARYGLGFLATFPVSVLLPAALAALVAIPVLRLESHYFALATLALAQGVLLVAVNWVSLTGGANGIPGVPGIVVAGWAVPRGLATLAAVWALAGLATLLAARYLSAARRTSFAVMRNAPLAAPAFGIDAGRLRLQAFLLSAGFAGAAGALYSHTTRVISPEALGFTVMVSCLTMTVLGGRLRLAGAFAGALLLTFLPEWLRDFQEYYLIGVGVLLLAMVIAAPDGLVETLLPHRGTPVAAAAAAHLRGAGERMRAGLAIRAVAKRYGGVAALDGVDLTVAPGEVHGLIGPNGSGKTTLANAVSGHARIDGGRIDLTRPQGGGLRLDTLPAFAVTRAGVARSFQTPQLPGALTPRVLLETARRHATADGDTAPDIDGLLAQLDLAASADRPCAALAHGERRRTEIARALAGAPSVLILDEPAAGMTAGEAAIVAGAVRRAAADGVAVLVIDHDMDFLVPLADRLTCLAGGRVVADGAPDEVIADPAVRDAYFGGGAR